MSNISADGRICTACGELKPFSEFHHKLKGFAARCKNCVSSARRAVYKSNKAALNAARRARYASDADFAQDCRNGRAQYYKANRDACLSAMAAWRATPEGQTYARAYNRHYTKAKRRISIQFRLGCVLRARLSKVVAGEKAGSHVRDLGCTLDELKCYLESKFLPGMSWENYGITGWHIDHIKPLTHFDLTDHSQFLAACHYKNLQPLWAADNIRKSNRA